MPDRNQNLQDAFLNAVRKSKTPLTIFLVNGVKLQGVVTWFDNFCVLLRREGQVQLVYKHAISTIMPGGPVQLHDPNIEGEDEEYAIDYSSSCLLYTSPSPRDLSTARMPSSA